MMKITPRVAMEVAHHEGMVRQTYFDSVKMPTWSVGITSASGHNVERYWGNPQPLEKCIEVWLWVMERYADDVRKVFDGYDLSEAQFAAALSFHFNTGAIARATWVRQWKAGQITKARASFMNWSKPKSIIPRRRAERDLFFDGQWSGDGTMLEYTRLTSRKTPVWSSARRINITEAVSAALGPRVTQSTQPTTREPSSLFTALLDALKRILAALKGGKA